MKTRILLTLILFIITSCNELLDLDKKDGINEHTESIVEDESDEKTDSFDENKIKIIQVGTFHGDEIWESFSIEGWFGLFKNKENFVLKSTTVVIEKVFDEILDEKGDNPSGWKIKTKDNQESILLIQGVDFLDERAIISVDFDKNELYPGDSLTFTFNEIDYFIYVKGFTKNKQQKTTELNDIKNYKLYISATINKQKITQLIANHVRFSDKIPQFIFVGDIDGDGFIDLIINDSNHYNVTNLVLFLSKTADKGKLLKKVAEHRSVGC
jgi:hypothetical protein